MKLQIAAKYSGIVLNSFAVLTVLSLLLAVFSQLTSSTRNIGIFFCSDTLYLPSVYQDVVVDKHALSDWQLNPAPNYFPDMAFYFLLMFCTHNFVVSSFLFSILQYLLIGFLFVKLLRLIVPGISAYYNLFIYSLLSFFILEFFFFSKDFLHIFFLLVNSYHAGAFVMMLLSTYLSLAYIQKKKVWRLLLLFCVGFLMMLSDKLFVVLYVIPMCLTSILLFKRIGLRTMLYLVGTCVLFTGLGGLVDTLIATIPYDLLAGTEAKALDQSIHQFGQFFDTMKGYMSSFSIRAITIYLFLVSLGLMLYLFIRSRKQEGILPGFYALFSLIFSVCVICAPMAAGKYEGADCIRYNIYPFYLAILNLAVFMACTLRPGMLVKTGRGLLVAGNLCLLFIGLWQLKAGGLRDYFQYYPEEVRLVDEVAARENLKYGVGTYWEAKKITLFSKKNVKVYAVFEDIAFYLHVANDKWFFDNMFNFVVLNDFKDTLYKAKLKDIEYLSNTPQLRLIKTRPFFYRRETGSTAINTEIK